MYIPAHFSNSDKSQTLNFMKQYSFATLVSLQQGIPVATHLPFVIEEKDDSLILISHVARANEQWKELEEQTALIIFTEPHAYISPGHYDTEKNVPTWNYAAVHVYGKVTILTGEQNVMQILEKTIRYYEADYQHQWDQLPEKFKTGMINGIVAFEMKVTGVQAKYKLSQNRTLNEQKTIIEFLKEGNHTSQHKVAAMMEDMLEGKRSNHES